MPQPPSPRVLPQVDPPGVRRSRANVVGNAQGGPDLIVQSVVNRFLRGRTRDERMKAANELRAFMDDNNFRQAATLADVQHKFRCVAKYSCLGRLD